MADSNVTDIEMILRQIAALAWRDRMDPATYKMTRKLTDKQSVVSAKVKVIVDHVREHMAHGLGVVFDADDAVLVTATMCLAVGIRCRIVGARRGQSWTCWLAYEDGGQWVTVDVLEGIGNDRKPDERIDVECAVKPYRVEEKPGGESAQQFKARREAEAQNRPNAAAVANLVYGMLSGKKGEFGIDLVRPPNPAHGHAVAVLFADGRDVVIRFEEQGGK